MSRARCARMRARLSGLLAQDSRSLFDFRSVVTGRPAWVDPRDLDTKRGYLPKLAGRRSKTGPLVSYGGYTPVGTTTGVPQPPGPVTVRRSISALLTWGRVPPTRRRRFGNRSCLQRWVGRKRRRRPPVETAARCGQLRWLPDVWPTCPQHGQARDAVYLGRRTGLAGCPRSVYRDLYLLWR